MDGSSAGDSRSRYAIGTLLSAVGIPFRYLSGATVEKELAGVPCVFLHVNGDRPPAGLPPGSTTVSLPGLDGWHDAAGADSVPESLFAMLARSEEVDSHARDKHDRFEWAASAVSTLPNGAPPLVTRYARSLEAASVDAFCQAGIPMLRIEPWPSGKLFAASLSHDVDVVRRGKLGRGVAVRDVTSAVSNLARGQFESALRETRAIASTAAGSTDPYWTFDRIASLEAAYGYRSTYFFMAGRLHPEDSAYDLASPRMSGLTRDLLSSGCEIGLHGSYASYRDARLLAALKQTLEQRIGRPVAGHRNHFLRFTVPESWEVQRAVGLSYDSTLGFSDMEGFRGGHAFPYHPYDRTTGSAMDLLEIPLCLMEVTLHKYRKLRGYAALAAVARTIQETASVRGLATLLWHNDTFYDPEFPGCEELYRFALEAISQIDAYVAPLGKIDAWWRARESARVTPLEGERPAWRLECPFEMDGLTLRVSHVSGLPVPQSAGADASVRRDGDDWLVSFGRLQPGTELLIECQ